MPYNPNYLMKLAARGRPLPHIPPEQHLWQAASSLDLWELREAFGMGASPHARNHDGTGVLSALTQAGLRTGAAPRALQGIKDAWRIGSRLERCQDDVSAFHAWMTQPGLDWLTFACSHPNMPWSAKDHRRQTALHILAGTGTREQISFVQKHAPVPATAWEDVDFQQETPLTILARRGWEPIEPVRPKIR